MGRIKRFFSRLGPGLVTGCSDDDPSGIAAYTQAGAQFGLLTLWTAFITFPLMFVVQEMCARIGMVTSLGLATNIKKHYAKSILNLTVLFTVPAIILNIGADIAGMGAVANLIVPAIPAFLFSLFFYLDAHFFHYLFILQKDRKSVEVSLFVLAALSHHSLSCGTRLDCHNKEYLYSSHSI